MSALCTTYLDGKRLIRADSFGRNETTPKYPPDAPEMEGKPLQTSIMMAVFTSNLLIRIADVVWCTGSHHGRYSC